MGGLLNPVLAPFGTRAAERADPEASRVPASGSPGWIAKIAALVGRMTGTAASAESPLRIEARLSLGPKKSLALVDCHGRRVLLALSGDAIVPVLQIAEPKPRVRNTKEPAQ